MTKGTRNLKTFFTIFAVWFPSKHRPHYEKTFRLFLDPQRRRRSRNIHPRPRRKSRKDRGRKKGKPLKFNFQTIKRMSTDWKPVEPSRLFASKPARHRKRTAFRQLNEFLLFVAFKRNHNLRFPTVASSLQINVPVRNAIRVVAANRL